MTEEKQSQQERKVHIGYFALAFIDVLSQREKLSKIVGLPHTDEEQESFFEQWRETFGVIDAYRTMFNEFFDNFMKYRPPLIPGLSPERQEMLARHMKNVIKKQVFSDSMIYHVPLADEPDRLPITSVLSLLSGCAGTFLLGLAQGITCRGGIDVGIAAEFSNGEVYGPALYQAYHLESERAQYPRIVIGQGFSDYINSEMAWPGADAVALHRRLWAQDCARWIVDDVDGTPILDFAGPATKKAFPDLQSAVEPALKFVEGEWEKFRVTGNAKLAARYFLLHTYLASRKEQVWK
jgi:hypothetical protein